MTKALAALGQTFGRLTVISDGRLATCRCVCGTVIVARRSHLRSGNTASCGCRNLELMRQRATTHGMSPSGAQPHPLYATWAQMRHRCTSRWRKDFERYGGRGISVCERWQGREGFVNFLADMGDRPAGTTLERRDNALGYGPENCVWATTEEQQNNKRTNRVIILGGRPVTLSRAARSLNIKVGTLWQRLNRGWSVERAVSTGVRR